MGKGEKKEEKFHWKKKKVEVSLEKKEKKKNEINSHGT